MSGPVPADSLSLVSVVISTREFSGAKPNSAGMLATARLVLASVSGIDECPFEDERARTVGGDERSAAGFDGHGLRGGVCADDANAVVAQDFGVAAVVGHVHE